MFSLTYFLYRCDVIHNKTNIGTGQSEFFPIKAAPGNLEKMMAYSIVNCFSIPPRISEHKAAPGLLYWWLTIYTNDGLLYCKLLFYSPEDIRTLKTYVNIQTDFQPINSRYICITKYTNARYPLILCYISWYNKIGSNKGHIETHSEFLLSMPWI